MARSLIAFLALAVLSLPAAAADQLFVSGFSSNRVNIYSSGDGDFVHVWQAVQGPQAVVVAPSGDIVVAEENRDRILRFDGFTGRPLGALVEDDAATPEDETGGLDGPTAIAYGPDGSLYVASFETDSVLRYDAETGAFLDVFVASADHGLNGPDTGTIFGPDGHLYVPSFFSDRVLRYDGGTGAFIDEFVGFQSGGLRRPRTILFRGDGTVIVSSEGNDRIPLYDAVTGDSLGDFVPPRSGGLVAPSGMAFGPDGDLYVTSTSGDRVLEFDGETGDPVGEFVPRLSGFLDGPTYCVWLSEFHVRLEAPAPGIAGLSNDIVATAARPSQTVVFGVGTSAGEAAVRDCPGVFVSVSDLRRAGRVVADSEGVARLTRFVPARFAGRTVLVQAVEASSCRTSPVLEVTFD